MIEALALAALIRSCAPNVDPVTEADVVLVESGANPLAIADPDDGARSYFPATLESAIGTARGLLARGHRVAVGLGQVLLPRAGYRLEDMFQPCANLSASRRILTDFYLREVRAGGDPQAALDRALSDYNSGNPTASRRYALMVRQRTDTPYARVVASVVDGVSPPAVRGKAVSGPAPHPHKEQDPVALGSAAW